MTSSTKTNRYCSVFGCLNNSYANPELSFFTVPIERERRQQWLQLIGREELLNRGTYRVCEAHFNVKDVMVGRVRKMLKNDCLPCMHLPGASGDEKQTQTDITTATTSTQTEKIIRSDNITQTPASLAGDSPRSRKLKAELLECKKRLRLYAIEQNSTKAQKNAFYKLCDRFLSKNLAELVKAQTLLNSSNSGNRYTLAYKIFCLNLYNGSPQAYSLLQKTICLPCRTTLNKLNIPISTELNDQLMAALKLKVNTMSDKQKQCTLVMGAMSLKANLFYDTKFDKIIGFHEIDGVQSPSPAKQALVILVRGVFVEWSQAIGFALLSERKNNDAISKWIDKIILNLFEIGLKIRVFVSDLGSDSIDVAKERGVTVDRTYFTISGHKIYYIFDVPHLIKLVRNNMMIYDFHFKDNTVAKFDHIIQFYEHDQTKTYKQANKLINSHINPNYNEKNKVSYATELLSRSVASGLSTYIDFNIINESARHTVEFIKMVNDLFDALNSSTLRHSYPHKSAFSGKEEQIQFFKNMLIVFQSLKLINPKDGTDGTSVEFIQGFQITIQSVINLYEDLKREGYKYLMTRRLNHDIIEKFFAKIRAKNGNVKEPSSRQFTSAFGKIYFENITQALKEGNCAEHLTEFLTHLKDFEKTDNEIDNAAVFNDENILREVVHSDYAQLDLPETNALFYICGALLKKSVDRHTDCDILKLYLNTDHQACNLNAEATSLYSREFSKNKTSLMIPPAFFIAYIERLEQVFCQVFEQKHINYKIGTSIYEQIKYIDFPTLCPCFPKTYLQKLYIRMRIYFTLTTNNKAFRNGHKYFSVAIL